MKLSCGVEIVPGTTTRESLLAQDAVRRVVSSTANTASGRLYDQMVDELGHDDASAEAAGYHGTVALETQAEVFEAIMNCWGRRVHQGRINSELQNLFLRQEQRLLEESFELSDEDDLWPITVPGNPPHYAADCTDCHHPRPGACSACHVWDA